MKWTELSLPDSGKHESLADKKRKRAITYHGTDHRKHHESLVSTGSWHDWVLVTLTAVIPEYRPMWFIRMWRRSLKLYNERYPGHPVNYHIVANNGESGQERASAHLIFDADELWPDLDALRECWEAATNQRGKTFIVTSAGGRATVYQSWNAMQPEALEEQWNLKLRPYELV